MNWNRIFTVALTLGVFTSGLALAADPTFPDPEKAAREAERHALIAKYDANRDGALDAAERAAMKAELAAVRLAEQEARFLAMDEDGSGDLSLLEFSVGAPVNASAERVNATFTRMDANIDGLVSLEEFTTKPTPPDAGPRQLPGGQPRKGGSKVDRGRASVAFNW